MASEDVFGSDAPVVDFDVLEAAKENVQPLAGGRRATALSAILSTPHAQRESKLAATRNRLRINVEVALEDEEDDPLEAYCRLVNWTVENYPQGHSAESGIIELLEEATRVLKDDREGRWRGEMKYLKLWLLYTSFVEKPTIIYNFLIANEIGTDFALLYEEFADVLERDGRRKETDETYLLGIARRASPPDHLKARYSDFQKRMMCAAALPAEPAPVAGTTRTALSTTSAASTASFPGRATSVSDQRAPSNARLQVFADPTSEYADAAGNAFPDVGTRKTRVKENVPETKKMAGSTVRQPGKTKRLASGAASTSSFVPYVDTEADIMPPPPVPAKKARDAVPRTPSKGRIQPFADDEVDAGVPSTPKFVPFQDEPDASSLTMSTPAPESVMKVKKADEKEPAPTSEAEALRRDPLKNYTAMQV
ncbi:Mad3/BUB1 homology region 1-domain-containing protein [Mycena alexandri]|uniref:Mad3/BUB1 homology region 1-domain-containing protein n=1 Tax=Mycena alexandri TaxID=1745969 RepID=A0AAD6SQM6_9AGAR|nr:Mad3/BUB1 homology region 1-domain-containing protein [Mycena alexandri]